MYTKQLKLYNEEFSMKWSKPKKETHEANLKSSFYYTRGDERSVMVNEQATNDRP